MPLTLQSDVFETASLLFETAREGVLSWNTFSAEGSLEIRLLRARNPATAWMRYAQWTPQWRQSFSPSGADARIDVDVVRSSQPFDGIEVRAPGVLFRTLTFSTPATGARSAAHSGGAHILDVPARTQYLEQEQRGWCSPASLSMINAYHGLDYPVDVTARAVFDRAYNGTGNWSFNVAFSGSLGLRACVVHLRDLAHARRLIEAGIPLAISYGWYDDELPGAPLPRSDGHLAVLIGFTANGDCALNDPAAPGVRVAYPREALERLWLRAGGVAYAIAPQGLEFEALVNE